MNLFNYINTNNIKDNESDLLNNNDIDQTSQHPNTPISIDDHKHKQEQNDKKIVKKAIIPRLDEKKKIVKKAIIPRLDEKKKIVKKAIIPRLDKKKKIVKEKKIKVFIDDSNYKREKNILHFFDTDNIDYISFSQVKNVLKSFYDESDYYSLAFDIVALYLKGHKIIYTESQSYVQCKLNLLMLPAIFLSGIASVLALTIEEFRYGAIILACTNAFITFLLAIINYLKLDASAEAFRIASNEYDKLQTECEFKSGMFLIVDDNMIDYNDKSKTILESISQRITKIKNTNKFIIPALIRHFFSKTYNLNIFMKVKEIFKDENLIIHDIKNEINHYKQVKSVQLDNNSFSREGHLYNIEKKINALSRDYINMFSRYKLLEERIQSEINDLPNKKSWFHCF